MTYKVIADDEVTVVLTRTIKGHWKAVATAPDEQHAQAYIAYQDMMDAATALSVPLRDLLNGGTRDPSLLRIAAAQFVKKADALLAASVPLENDAKTEAGD